MSGSPQEQVMPVWSRAKMTLAAGLLVAGIGGAVAGRALRPGNTAATKGQERAVLYVSPGELRAGEVAATNSFQHTLHVENRGPGSVTIRAFEGSCSCTSVSPSRLSLGPNERKEVRVTIDLLTLPLRRDGSHRRPFAVDVRPCIEGEAGCKQAGQWTIRGHVLRHVVLSPWRVEFGRHAVTRQPIPTIGVQMTVDPLVHGFEVRTSSPLFEVKSTPAPGQAHKHHLAVVPTKRLGLGSYLFTVSVEPRGAGGKALPSSSLEVSGSIVQDVQPTVPEVLFGHAPIRTVQEEVLQFVSASGAPFAILAIDCDGDGLTAERQAPNDSMSSVVVRWTVTEEGERSGSVKCLIRDSTGQTYSHTISVVINGAPRGLGRSEATGREGGRHEPLDHARESARRVSQPRSEGGVERRCLQRDRAKLEGEGSEGGVGPRRVEGHPCCPRWVGVHRAVGGIGRAQGRAGAKRYRPPEADHAHGRRDA